MALRTTVPVRETVPMTMTKIMISAVAMTVTVTVKVTMTMTVTVTVAMTVTTTLNRVYTSRPSSRRCSPFLSFHHGDSLHVSSIGR